MKAKILSLLVVLMSIWFVHDGSARFSSDRVLIYGKAGQESIKANVINVKGRVADYERIIFWFYDVERSRNSITSSLEYFMAPYSIPDKGCALSQSYIATELCQCDTMREKIGYNENVKSCIYAFMMTFALVVIGMAIV